MDQISVLSMAQAVTEKRQNPPAAENSQTQSSFREMLADRRKALDKGGEEAFPTEKPEEENHGESTVSRTDSDMERMLWAAFMLMPASPEKQMPTPENVQSQGSEPLLILSETGTSGVQNELQKPQVSASDAAAAVETAQPQEQPLMRAQELERPAEVADTSAGPEQLRNADVEIKRADEPEQKPAYFAETPVFQEVSDIPIKVGETETVEQPGEARPLEIQLGEKLTQVLKQGESKVELQLEPRNLGRVQVEMTWDQEGTLRVSMYAENSRTRTLLEQDLAGLRSVLSQNTQQEVRVEVSRQQESQQQLIRPVSCNAKKDIFRCPFAIHVSMHVSVFICIHISMDAVKPIHLLPYLPSAPQNAPGFPYAFHRTGTGPPSSAYLCHIPGPVLPGMA